MSPAFGVGDAAAAARAAAPAAADDDGAALACNATNVASVLHAASLDGPWAAHNAAIVPSAAMNKSWGPNRMLDNPSAVFFANGSLLMASRGGDPADEAWSDGVVTAPGWRGPYTQHGMIGEPKSAGPALASPQVEDPFVWRDARGHFHALFHKLTDEHPSAGGHAYSRDGWAWTLTDTAAFTTDVRTDDGATHAFFRRERPHLLFDDDGTTPLALFTSLTNWSSGAPTDTDKAFTFAQSIAS